MSDTPKRNEAVAPVAWAFQSELDELRGFEEFSCLLARNADLGQSTPLYPASAIDALQGEVSRLRELLDRVERCAYPVCKSIDPRGYRWSEAYLDQVLPDILNLEPPTYGR